MILEMDVEVEVEEAPGRHARAMTFIACALAAVVAVSLAYLRPAAAPARSTSVPPAAQSTVVRQYFVPGNVPLDGVYYPWTRTPQAGGSGGHLGS